MKNIFKASGDNFRKTKKILEIYRFVVWSLKERLENMENVAIEMGSKDLGQLLDYLSDYDNSINKRRLEERVVSIFNTKWLIEVVDRSLVKLKSYPDKGEMYFEILVKKYIVEKRLSELELCEIAHCGRTTYFKRLSEAIDILSILIGDLDKSID
jgi:hypothetical protein